MRRSDVTDVTVINLRHVGGSKMRKILNCVIPDYS